MWGGLGHRPVCRRKAQVFKQRQSQSAVGHRLPEFYSSYGDIDLPFPSLAQLQFKLYYYAAHYLHTSTSHLCARDTTAIQHDQILPSLRSTTVTLSSSPASNNSRLG